MGLTTSKITAIKAIAGDKDVIVLLDAGHTVTGVIKEVTADHIKMESKDDTIFLTVDSIKALRIRK